MSTRESAAVSRSRRAVAGKSNSRAVSGESTIGLAGERAHPPNRSTGSILMANGVVSGDQMRIALTEQKRCREPLGRILVRLGFASDGVVRDVLAGVHGHDRVDLSKIVIDGDAVKLIPREIALRYRILALAHDGEAGRLTVATSDPFNVIAQDQVRALFETGGGDPAAARWRGGARQGNRTVLRTRTVDRRNSCRDRDRRNRPRKPRSRAGRIQPTGGFDSSMLCSPTR